MRVRSATPRPSAASPEAGRSLDWPGLACGAVLAAGAIAVYGRTFSVPLLFDDAGSIANNLSIRKLWPLLPVLSPPADFGVGGRPLLNLSYALNYAWGGTAVFGYHLVNLLIHLLAGWTLFALVRRTLRQPVLARTFAPDATLLALVVCAIWTWHPVQTESVTYLSQRAESLMGLFYLLTLYCFARGSAAGERRGRAAWLVASVLACLAGVATKEPIATAPLLVFLYDRTFVSESFAGAWRRHWPLYLGLAATWLPLAGILMGMGHRDVGFGRGVAWWVYGLTECQAIVKYLLLSFWPNPLVFDYGPTLAAGLSGVWPAALVLLALLAGTAVALRRCPAAGFAAAWFFLILAPTSSIVPVVRQPVAESRLYLPLAGVAALAVLGGYALAGRRTLVCFAAAAVVLGWAAARRNEQYASGETLWKDTIAKRPGNPRAYNNLGFELENLPGRVPEAIALYEEALRLDPDYADAHVNLGYVLGKTPGRLNDAIAENAAAARLEPDHSELHYNLANSLREAGRSAQAVLEYEKAIRLNPDFAEARSNLASVLETIPGRLADAVAEYAAAVRLQPDNAALHFNLAAALLKVPGRTEEAKVQLAAGLRLQPGNDLARRLLAELTAGQP